MRRISLLSAALALLVLGTVIVGGALVGIVIPWYPPVMIVAGAALVLLFPGYALAATLFRAQRLPTAETWLYSVGLSISIVIFAGLILNVSPAGLTGGSWTVAIGLATVTLAATALFLRLKGSGGGTVATNSNAEETSVAPSPWSPVLSLRPALLFALAGTIAVLAVSVAVMGATQQRPTSDLTSLWVSPDSPGAGATVGVTNGSGQPVQFLIILADAGGTIREWPVDLAPNETWQIQIAGSTIAATQGDVIATVSLAADPNSVIRRVVLRASPKPSPSE